jgi:tetratricopeptide (TPR) repeat protein
MDCGRKLILKLVLTVQLASVALWAQSMTATLHGVVRDANGHPAAGATVSLQSKGNAALTLVSDSFGSYNFRDINPETYTLRAGDPGGVWVTSQPVVLRPGESKSIDLTLPATTAKAAQPSITQPEFFDEPHFTVAGVTDTTNAGGHGSDVVARNQEALAKATASLSTPPSDSSASSGVANRIPSLELAYQTHPGDFRNAYELALAYAGAGKFDRARAQAQTVLSGQNKTDQQKAELHHLLADVDEKLGDFLNAVHEYQLAAEFETSETNLFDWGAELLLHKAAEPAIEVFTKGSHAFPQSVRMLTGLGAAWYSLGSYDKAVQRFGEASDLNPADPNPYVFMGKMQASEMGESPQALEKLARFAKVQPQNAWANYYYAVALWKEKSTADQAQTEQIQSLLERAVHLDPKLGVAYLQLGIVYSEQGDIPKAIVSYRHAIEASPDLEQAHYRLGRLYNQTGETAEAQTEVKEYERISHDKTQEVERERHELQRFVYEMRDRTLETGPKN